MKTELEICAYSLESCLAAKEGGADRVELCAGMYDGGTTPSAATIRMAREITGNMQLFVMIRPRGGDFLYSDLEYRQMREDILFAKETGADGVVLGILDRAGKVDKARTAELVRLALPMQVTFHRAFDMTDDYKEALEAVIEAGCYRILTSGLRNTVMEGYDTLREIVRSAEGRIHIMAGSGVCAANAATIAALGVNALHMSGKSSRDSKMSFRNPAVFMGGVPGIPEYDIAYSDVEKIRNVKSILQNF